MVRSSLYLHNHFAVLLKNRGPMLKTQILMNNRLYSTVHFYRELHTLFDNVRDTYIRSVCQLHGVVWMYN